jgi:broad specificity phosphatase PhoE
LEKEIFIIRHGETDFNQLGIVQGKGVNSSINAKGTQQAQAFFEAYRNENFEKIYISQLQRTAQTVAPFNELNIPVEIHEGLDEISWGIHEGKKDGDTFKDFYRILHLWQAGDTTEKIDEGESPEEVQLRQQKFVKMLLATKEKKILICSHGRAIRILLCTMLNQPLKDMDTFPHHNVSLYKMHYDANGFKIVLFNDIGHLNG